MHVVLLATMERLMREFAVKCFVLLCPAVLLPPLESLIVLISHVLVCRAHVHAVCLETNIFTCIALVV